jgi:predicted Zn-dependent peptidase
VLASGLALIVLAGRGGAAAPSGHEAITLGAPEVETIETGLRVAAFPDARLPIVQIQLLVPAGVATETAEQSGIASLTAQTLKAGTTSRSAASLGADLDRLGGILNVTVGRDYVTVSGSFLARDLDAGLELIADVVAHPVFPQDELDQVKSRTVNGLLQLQRNPAAAEEEQLWAQAFGDHPYGAPLLGTLESLPHLTVEEVRAFYRERYRPDHAVLAIAGDVTPGQALASAREWFGNWSGRSVPARPVPSPSAIRSPGIVLIDRPDMDRAEIRLGATSAPRDAPDYLAFAIANHCLGGASWSWLQRTSASRGAAAEVHTSLTPLRGTGLFMLSASAVPESAGAAVARLRESLTQFLGAAVPEDEIGRARRYFQNVFPLQFETLAARAAQWLAADFYGLPADFFDRYDARIGAVGAEQAAVAARHWLDPARLSVVVVGPAARIKPGLDRLGPVELRAAPAALAGTRSVAQQGPPNPEQERRGHEIFDQALAAHGGAERLKAIKDSSIEGDLVLTQGGNQVRGVLRQVRKEPYKMVFTTRFQDFETRQTLNGRAAWSRAGSESSEVVAADTSQVAGLRSGFDADPAHLLLAGGRAGARLAFEGRTRLLGRTVDVVGLDAPGLPRRRYHFDAESHRMLAIEEAAPAVSGGSTRRIFTDFKTVDGVLWPMSEERQVAGTRIMLLTLRSVALDGGVPDALFARPAVLDKPFIRMK